MQVPIRKMGNSHGILIPKPILTQLGLEDAVDLQVRDGLIELRPVRRDPRAGWAADACRLAAEEEPLVWPGFAVEGDATLIW